MNNEDLFNNFNLTNDEIESILRKYERLINFYCYTNGYFNEELKQEIHLKIFITLSKNRKK